MFFHLAGEKSWEARFMVKTTRAVSKIVTGNIVVTGFKGEQSQRQSTVKRARGWIRVNFREFAQQLSPLAPLPLSVHTCTYERDMPRLG